MSVLQNVYDCVYSLDCICVYSLDCMCFYSLDCICAYSPEGMCVYSLDYICVYSLDCMCAYSPECICVYSPEGMCVYSLDCIIICLFPRLYMCLSVSGIYATVTEQLVVYSSLLTRNKWAVDLCCD